MDDERAQLTPLVSRLGRQTGKIEKSLQFSSSHISACPNCSLDDISLIWRLAALDNCPLRYDTKSNAMDLGVIGDGVNGALSSSSACIIWEKGIN